MRRNININFDYKLIYFSITKYLLIYHQFPVYRNCASLLKKYIVLFRLGPEILPSSLKNVDGSGTDNLAPFK